MKLVSSLWNWIVTPPEEPVSPLGAIWWWEARRIPYNLIIGGMGVISLLVYLGCVDTRNIPADQDYFEPMSLFIAPFVINICYTFGWLVDAPVRLLFPNLDSRYTPRLLRAGFAFSMLVITAPALAWGIHRALRLIHAIP